MQANKTVLDCHFRAQQKRLPKLIQNIVVKRVNKSLVGDPKRTPHRKAFRLGHTEWKKYEWK